MSEFNKPEPKWWPAENAPITPNPMIVVGLVVLGVFIVAMWVMFSTQDKEEFSPPTQPQSIVLECSFSTGKPVCYLIENGKKKLIMEE